ncbi:hypothetical protein LTS18_009531, partial [Coniosporium uncinatum]
MPPRPPKRRKLSPSPQDEFSDDASSFSGFSDTVNGVEERSQEDEAGEPANGSIPNGEVNVNEDNEDEEDLDNPGDVSDEPGDYAAVKQERATPLRKKAPAASNPLLQKQSMTNGMHAHTISNSQGANYTGEAFKSNMFKLQMDDLLEQSRVKYGKKEKPAEVALRTLKTILEDIPRREPTSVSDAERSLIKSCKVAVPFPFPRPPRDANYKLEYAKPANINVAGSYALRTATRTGEELGVDLVVTMPSSIFQDKDYLNYRYFYKRAYYLACLAAGIKGSRDHQFNLHFDYLNGNHLQPILVVQSSADGSNNDFSSSNCYINIIPCVSETLFPIGKTLPDKNCVRTKGGDDNASMEQQKPTPYYNASLRADSSMMAYLKLLHATSVSCDSFRDACVLGRIWLRQRGLSSHVQSGGFGNFEWASTMALLLQGGGPKGRPLLSSGYSSYQLFKAMLQFLASKDLQRNPLVVGQEHALTQNSVPAPTLFDGANGVNIVYKMTSSSYHMLRQEATTAVASLGDSAFDQFEATFISRADHPLYKFDYNIEIPVSALFLTPNTEDDSAELQQ